MSIGGCPSQAGDLVAGPTGIDPVFPPRRARVDEIDGPSTGWSRPELRSRLSTSVRTINSTGLPKSSSPRTRGSDLGPEIVSWENVGLARMAFTQCWCDRAARRLCKGLISRSLLVLARRYNYQAVSAPYTFIAPENLFRNDHAA